jgi:drug/metabolite transporter (DMT)-like permease
MGLASLFMVASAIWGSTWLAIKFQLGVVAPVASVAYRFALAAVLLGIGCLVLGRSLRFPLRVHPLLAAQGALLFGFNYVAVYLAEQYIASGLAAVLFSTMVFMSLVGTRLAYRTPISARALIGATLGVGGIALLFLPEIAAAGNGGDAAKGIALGLGSALIATGGNLVSMQMQRRGLPIFETTAWGMAYGSALVALTATLFDTPWTFDLRFPYIVSLAYLAVFGSIVAFGAYLTLLRQVGAGTASYVNVAIPVLAMLLSTGFEAYRWTGLAALGVVLAVAGIVLVLRQPRADRPRA